MKIEISLSGTSKLAAIKERLRKLKQRLAALVAAHKPGAKARAASLAEQARLKKQIDEFVKLENAEIAAHGKNSADAKFLGEVHQRLRTQLHQHESLSAAPHTSTVLALLLAASDSSDRDANGIAASGSMSPYNWNEVCEKLYARGIKLKPAGPYYLFWDTTTTPNIHVSVLPPNHNSPQAWTWEYDFDSKSSQSLSAAAPMLSGPELAKAKRKLAALTRTLATMEKAKLPDRAKLTRERRAAGLKHTGDEIAALTKAIKRAERASPSPVSKTTATPSGAEAARSKTKKAFTKGDRVVVKEAKDNWYLGTVAQAGVRLKVIFDDGASAMIGPEDFKHVKLVDAKTKARKKVLTDAEAGAMHTAGKPAPTLKAAQTKVETIQKVAKETKAQRETRNEAAHDAITRAVGATPGPVDAALQYATAQLKTATTKAGVEALIRTTSKDIADFTRMKMDVAGPKMLLSMLKKKLKEFAAPAAESPVKVKSTPAKLAADASVLTTIMTNVAANVAGDLDSDLLFEETRKLDNALSKLMDDVGRAASAIGRFTDDDSDDENDDGDTGSHDIHSSLTRVFAVSGKRVNLAISANVEGNMGGSMDIHVAARGKKQVSFTSSVKKPDPAIDEKIKQWLVDALQEAAAADKAAPATAPTSPVKVKAGTSPQMIVNDFTVRSHSDPQTKEELAALFTKLGIMGDEQRALIEVMRKYQAAVWKWGSSQSKAASAARDKAYTTASPYLNGAFQRIGAKIGLIGSMTANMLSADYTSLS